MSMLKLRCLHLSDFSANILRLVYKSKDCFRRISFFLSDTVDRRCIAGSVSETIPSGALKQTPVNSPLWS